MTSGIYQLGADAVKDKLNAIMSWKLTCFEH